jgi:hypothetical protein
MVVGSLLGGLVLWFAAGLSFGSRPAPLHFPADAGRDVTSHYDRGLGALVTRVARRSALVYCQSEADWRVQTRRFDMGASWNAYTEYWTLLTVDLSPQVCAELLRLRTLRAPLAHQPDLDALAWSVAALAHEAMHVSGIRSESLAQCYGMQAIATTATLLGRSPREGRMLSRWYWRRLSRRLPPSYRSPYCHDGGAFDRRPAVHTWP